MTATATGSLATPYSPFIYSLPAAWRQVVQFGAGHVLRIREQNGYSDSDFYALVAVIEADGSMTFTEVAVDSTRGGGGYIPRVDATEEVLAEYRRQREARLAEWRKADEDRKAATPAKGKEAIVVEGKHKGVQGEIIWVGPNRYANRWLGRKQYRLGIKPAIGETVWVNEEAVRVVGFEDLGEVHVDDHLGYMFAIAAGTGWPAL